MVGASWAESASNLSEPVNEWQAHFGSEIHILHRQINRLLFPGAIWLDYKDSGSEELALLSSGEVAY